MDVAEQAAALSGRSFGALVTYRRDLPVSKSFVLISLSTLTALIAEQEAAHAGAVQ